jgi:hypothetical protein
MSQKVPMIPFPEMCIGVAVPVSLRAVKQVSVINQWVDNL